MGSCGFFTIFTLRIYSWTILVIMISIYTHESMILAKKIIKIGQLRLKLEPNFKFVKISTPLDLKYGSSFSLS